MSRKLSMEEILEKGILQEGQEYLRDYLAAAKDPVGIYEHSKATSTCQEKVDLLNSESGLNWALSQAVKSLYFGHGGYAQCVVTPDFALSMSKRVLPHPGMSLTQNIPDYMEKGTCTPFIPDWDVSCLAGRVQHIYLHWDSGLEDSLSDFSIGGKGPDAHKRSLWIPYGVAAELLQKQFGDMVTLVNLYPSYREKSLKPIR